MSVLSLYDRNKKFVRILFSGLDYKDLKVQYDHFEADETISFTLYGDILPDDVEVEGYVRTDRQWYVIKEINDMEVCGNLDLEELEGVSVNVFTAVNQSIWDAAGAALQDTGWSVQSSITKVRSVQQFRKSPLELIKKIRDAWMCEVQFDTLNKVVTLEDEIGTDRGVFFLYGLNLRTATKATDSYDLVTRLYPIGKDGLTIEDVNGGVAYIENHQYSDKTISAVWEDTSYEEPDKLLEDAIEKLGDLSKPKISYTVDIRDLEKLNENSDEDVLTDPDPSDLSTEPLQDEFLINLKDENGALLYDMTPSEYIDEGDILYDEVGVELTDGSSYAAAYSFVTGDTVKIISKPDGIKDKQRVVKLTEYPDHPEKNSIELANTVLTWEELQKKLEAQADAWETISNTDGSINGYYVHGVEADGLVGIEVKINGNGVASINESTGVVYTGCTDYTASDAFWAYSKDGNIYTNATVTANVVSPSDKRLKKNIHDTEVQSALEVIELIPMRSFDWKKTDRHQKIGFIADELEQIDERMIQTGGNGYKAVDSFYLVGYLTKAIQELSAEVTALKARLED